MPGPRQIRFLWQSTLDTIKKIAAASFGEGKIDMHLEAHGIRTQAAAAAGLALALVFTCAAQAQDKTYVMKLGTATINDSQHESCKRFAAMVEKDSGGRVKGEIYPASQLGPIPRKSRGVQFGAIQGYVGPPEFAVGVDPRYEVVSAPRLRLANMAHGIRAASDPELQKMMLSLGANKGIHGAALFRRATLICHQRATIRHLADFKGKKLRVLAADMQQAMIKHLGGTPVAMTLGDVLPALQQGAIDGAVAAMTVYTTMHYWDAAKYVTEANQTFIFSMAFLSKEWFDGLPKDLQTIVDTDAGKAAAEVNPWEADFFEKQRQAWAQQAELINLPARAGRDDEIASRGRHGGGETEAGCRAGLSSLRRGGAAHKIERWFVGIG